MPKVSFLMPYYNRKRLLQLTLDSFEHFYNDQDVEVVLVDDYSDAEHRLGDLVSKYSLDINLIELKSKTGINPCYPYNVAAREAKGDIFVLTSPETWHLRNIFQISGNFEKMSDNIYLQFSVFCVTDSALRASALSPMPFAMKLGLVKSMEHAFYKNLGSTGYPYANALGSWYTHSRLRPSCLNFLSAMTRDRYYSISGFDERFRQGTGCDDRDFKQRLLKVVKDVEWYDNMVAIHMDHEVVQGLPPQTNEPVYAQTREHPYEANDDWGRQ